MGYVEMIKISWIIQLHIDSYLRSLRVILSINADFQLVILFDQINYYLFTVENIQKTESITDSKQPVYTRVGYRKGDKGEDIYICLHSNEDHDVVHITSDKIDLVSKGKVTVSFENTGTMNSLVKPSYEHNDNGAIDRQKTLEHLKDLNKYINVRDEDMCLVFSWLLCSLYPKPHIDNPILWIRGERNTGKTTSVKFLKKLIDPSMKKMLSQYTSENDFFADLNCQYVSVFDNVSTVTPKFNDMLCRAVTDDKIRTVITAKGTFYVNQHSNIVVNSLNTVSQSPELKERSFNVRTRQIHEGDRMTNEELENSFSQDTPYILGALLVALSSALRYTYYTPDIRGYTRLLDACIFGARVAHATEKLGLPFSELDFINALKAQKDDIDYENKEAIEDNIIAKTIFDMALEYNETESEIIIWNDSSEALNNKITERIKVKDCAKIPSGFPFTSQKFGKELSAISGLLSELGIHIDRSHREGNKRYTKITYTPNLEHKHTPTDISEVTQENVSDNEPQSTSNTEIAAHVLHSAEEVNKICAEENNNPDELQKKENTTNNLTITGSVPSTPSVINGIQPNNNLPLHTSLLNLTEDQLRHCVLSNLFVVPDVKVNTLIWKYWDIFNDMDYTWKVVRSRPECVKLVFNDGRILLCEPCNKGNKGLYRALLLSSTLRATTLKSNVSLEEALDICEDKAAQSEIANKKCKKWKPLFTYKRSEELSGPRFSLKHNWNMPYKAELVCFEGFEDLIKETEKLSKTMMPIKIRCVHLSSKIDFEYYLYEQVYKDNEIMDSFNPNPEVITCNRNRREEILESLKTLHYCSDKYFDILSFND